MKKKLFSIIMCVLMVMCFMPTAAFATGTYESNTTISTDTTISESTSISATVTVDSGKTLTIADGATLTITGTGKLIVNGTLKVEAGGTLDLTSSTNDCTGNTTAAESRTLKIANGASLIVNGTLKSKAQFNDILQYGTMTINSGATVTIGEYLSQTITYVGTDGMIVLSGENTKIVQEPRTKGEAATFADGYTYTLYGNASAGNTSSYMYITGKDQFIVANGATLTVNKMAMATGDQTGTVPTLENHIIVKSGGTLAVATGGELSLINSNAGTTYNSWDANASKRLIKIETGGKFDVSGTVVSNCNFNDICQLGTMTIYSGAKYKATSQASYMGASADAATIRLGDNTTVVSVPNTEGAFTGGYKYTLNGTVAAGVTDATSAENGVFEINGYDEFVIANGSTLTVVNMKLSGEKTNQLTVLSGGKLVKGSGALTVAETKTWKVSSGSFDFNPTDNLADNCIVKRDGNADAYTYTVLAKENLTDGIYLTNPTGHLAYRYYTYKNNDDTWTVYYSAPSGGSSSGSSTTTDNVVNTTETTKTDAGATTTVPETKATVKAETKTAADGTKTTTSTVDTTTASKIVEKAVENKSEEVIVNAGTTAVAETAAGTTTEVAIPAETVSQIAEKTTAAVTIETEAAEVSLDEKAVEAVAEQAGEAGSVKLVVETKAQDEKKVEVELKIETSNGAVSDFKGGNVTVTVKLNSALAAKPVICVYIDDNGVYHKVAGHKNADGTYTFTTGHFSTYAIMSVEDADAAIAKQADSAKELVKALSLKATSSKTKKGNIKVKLTVNADKIQAIEDLGYTVKYKFYRSTKKSSSYKAKFETAGKTYTNTTGKKGTRYYYKARVLVYDTEGTLVTYTALKQCKYATRVR